MKEEKPLFDGYPEEKKSIWNKENAQALLIAGAILGLIYWFHSCHPTNSAREFLNSKNYDSAYKILEGSLAYPWYKYDPIVYIDLSFCDRRRKNYDRAQKWLDRGYKLYEDPLPAFLNSFQNVIVRSLLYTEQGYLYTNLEKYDEAIKAFETAIKCDPCASAYIGLAGVTRIQKNNPKTEEVYKKGIEATKKRRYNGRDLERLYHERADYYRETNKNVLAISDLDDALSNYKCKDAYFDRAVLYAENKEFDKAISDLDSAIELEKQERFFHQRALYKMELKDNQGALLDINEAVKIGNPDCPSLTEDEKWIEQSFKDDR